MMGGMEEQRGEQAGREVDMMSGRMVVPVARGDIWGWRG